MEFELYKNATVPLVTIPEPTTAIMLMLGLMAANIRRSRYVIK